MSERLIVDALFVTESDLFSGAFDDAGTVTVCGKDYFHYGEVRRNFVSRTGNQHSIHHILVDPGEYEMIVAALLENEVKFGSADVDEEDKTPLCGRPPFYDFDSINLNIDGNYPQLEEMPPYDVRISGAYPLNSQEDHVTRSNN